MGNTWSQLGVIALGATTGAWLRWGLGLWLNERLLQFPLGTLAANCLGGFLMGVVLAALTIYANVSPLWRLLLTTGLLGGLTTFSSFSAEVFTLLQRGELYWGLALIGLHVVGTLLLTAFGWWCAQAFLQAWR